MGHTFEMDNASGGNAGRIVLLSDLYTMLGLTAPTALEAAVAAESLRMAEGAVIRHLHYNPVLAVQVEYYPLKTASVMGEKIWEVNETHAYLRETTMSAGAELQLMRLPIRQCQSDGSDAIEVRVDYDARSGTRAGSFGSDTIKVEGTDFYPNYDLVDSNGKKVCTDGVLRSFGMWPETPGSVKVTYLAGYTESELAGTDAVIDASPIREAVLDEATRRVHKAYSRMKKRTGFGTGALTSENLGDYSYSADAAILKQLVGSSSTLMAETVFKLEPFVNLAAFLNL